MPALDFFVKFPTIALANITVVMQSENGGSASTDQQLVFQPPCHLTLLRADVISMVVKKKSVVASSPPAL